MHPSRWSSKSRLVTRFHRAMLVAMAGIGCGTKSIVETAPIDAGGVDASDDAGATMDAKADTGPVDKCVATLYSPAPPDTCGDYYTYPCGLPAGLTVRGDCYFAVNDCNSLCPEIHYNCRAIDGFCSTNNGDAGVPDASAEGGSNSVDGYVIPNEAGAVIIDCSVCPGSPGRVPAGLSPVAGVRASSLLGAYFASAARLEAASVTAFRRLREELVLHDAPPELQAAARAAEGDEVRHTLAMARLARKHGGRYERPRVDDVAPRSLAAIAEENVVEGCARETFCALLATHQAEHAPDPEVARVMTAIAADETRHAALSWAIARWSLAKLDDAARTRIRGAWETALAGAAAGVANAEAVAIVAALPALAERQALAGELRDLWSDLLAA